MRYSSLVFAVGLAAAALPVAAQTAAGAPKFLRVDGKVVSINDARVTVTDKQGRTAAFALAPTWYAVVAKPVNIDAITPGSFVATANLDQADGGGKALELRLFEPGTKMGEGSRPMDQAGKTMTNATVTRISKGAGGRELDVAYPGGVRHILVPPDVQVIASTPAARTAVRPGVTIQSFAVPGDDGVAALTRITVRDPVEPPKF